MCTGHKGETPCKDQVWGRRANERGRVFFPRQVMLGPTFSKGPAKWWKVKNRTLPFPTPIKLVMSHSGFPKLEFFKPRSSVHLNWCKKWTTESPALLTTLPASLQSTNLMHEAIWMQMHETEAKEKYVRQSSFIGQLWISNSLYVLCMWDKTPFSWTIVDIKLVSILLMSSSAPFSVCKSKQ